MSWFTRQIIKNSDEMKNIKLTLQKEGKFKDSKYVHQRNMAAKKQISLTKKVLAESKKYLETNK